MSLARGWHVLSVRAPVSMSGREIETLWKDQDATTASLADESCRQAGHITRRLRLVLRTSAKCSGYLLHHMDARGDLQGSGELLTQTIQRANTFCAG